MVELAARLGGGHDAELTEAATGVPLNDLALDFALGRGLVFLKHKLRSRAAPASSSSSRPKGRSSRRRARGGARRRGRARRAALPAAGHVFGPLRRGADRAGAVIAVGDSREQALERARAAADEIRFLVE